ncbi:MAG: SWIM zinc finger family protein [Streptosporangiaceae bacterium]
MARSWEDWPPAKPIRVEGGIRARSKRGAIGEQWWSQRFISVLESFGMSGRLARGRSYARAGQVLNFELSQGKVTAQVQGSRPRPYQVRIGVLPLTTAQWRTVFARLASQALFRAKLLAGEMPHEIEDVFTECGTPLFPRTAADLDMQCSCPDWGVPCKHLAAVCYVLAEEFDLDPFAMLAWRGKNRDELLAALRKLQAGRTSAGRVHGGPVPAGSARADSARADSALAGPAEAGRGLLDVPAATLAGSLEAFWSPGLSPARLRALSVAPGTATPDLLLRMFPPPEIQVRGTDLGEVLAAAYGQLAAGAPPDADPAPG